MQSSIFFLAGVLMTTIVPAGAGITPKPFPRIFAPQDGLTVPVEQADRQEICLNGKWRFQPVAATLPAPNDGAWEKTLIRIPSPWNVNAFPDGSGLGGDFRCYPSYPKSWETVEAGWLQRSFAIPSSWKGERLKLRFQAVAGDVQVMVNGHLVAHHFDNFLPFEVDITDVANVGGQNELRVGVRKASLTDVAGPFGRRTYQGGSMWGQAIAGIWQDVYLHAMPVVHVSDVFIQPDLEHDQLIADVTVRNYSAHSVTLNLTADVREWLNHAGKDTLDAPEPKWSLAEKSSLTLKASTVSIAPHNTSVVRLTAQVKGRLKTWAPGAPNLYSLVCHLKAGKASDTKSTRFGWRQVSLKGSQVLLNGKPIIMKGDSWHFLGIPQMTRRYAWAWFKTLHDAGLNAVRLHAQPYPSFYLDMADEMGMLVLDESAVWASDGGPKMDAPEYWKDTERHVAGLVLRDRNHPSVFGWSVSNEVMAVVHNVYHAPKPVEDQASKMNGVWLGICRKLDPTRAWVSADGEEDGQGVMPTYVIHYGDRSTMDHAIATGKPWGVGEAGPAYYGSPKQIAEYAKDDRAYLSFADRMEGVAKVSYESLRDQRDKGASYRSVFNLVWYGLQPLELGMADTTKPPTLEDGISFGAFHEGQPGVQPERLGPYCTTLNPGYDSSLPLFRTWPLYDAMRDAAHDIEYKPSHPKPAASQTTQPVVINQVQVLGSKNGKLGQGLSDLGVTLSPTSNTLFIDGEEPPEASAKDAIDRTLQNGGVVFVWGAGARSLDRLNALLPWRLELTDRTASSLVASPERLTEGMSPSSLYFSELSPSTILAAGLDGPVVQKSRVLLSACNTDWKRWNNQPETTKTAMVLRSEREAKASGVALCELEVGPGRLILCNLPVQPQTSQAESLNRTLLRNLGVALKDSATQHNSIGKTGEITRALFLESFSAASIEDGLKATVVWPDWQIEAGGVVEGRVWKAKSTTAQGSFASARSEGASFSYMSLWVYSPKSLDDLLLDPHLPTLSLHIAGAGASQLWVGTKSVEMSQGASAPLLLRAGWNHLLLKVVLQPGSNEIRLKVVSSQPDYLGQIRGASQKPG